MEDIKLDLRLFTRYCEDLEEDNLSSTVIKNKLAYMKRTQQYDHYLALKCASIVNGLKQSLKP